METEPLIVRDQSKDQSKHQSKHQSKDTRDLVLKIIGIVSGNVIVLVGLVYAFMQLDLFDDPKFRPRRPFHRTSAFGISGISLLIYIGDLIYLHCKVKAQKATPIDSIFIIIQKICLSLILASICKFYSEDLIFISFAITIITTYFLIVIAWIWKPVMSFKIQGTLSLICLSVGHIILYSHHTFEEMKAEWYYYLISFVVVCLLIWYLAHNISEITKSESEFSTFELVCETSIIVNDFLSPLFVLILMIFYHLIQEVGSLDL